MLEPVRKEFGLPSVAAVVMKDGVIVAEGAVGSRRSDANLPVTLDDRYHLGSNTKAITALLAAQLVESGKLRWDTTLAGAFPEFAQTMPEPWRGATLEQVLSHSAGLPGDDDALADLYFDSAAVIRTLPAQRLAVIEKTFQRESAAQPGVEFVYSNFGYLVVGAMIERAAGKSWEALMHENVFQPFGWKTAGLGPQNSWGVADAPMPHLAEDGEVFIMEGGPTADVPGALGPAGNAHMSAREFADWAAWHAGMGARKPALISPETLAQLITARIETPPRMAERPGTPEMGKYALGWGVISFPWSDERTFLMHGGSNGMNLAWIVVRPEDDLALVLMTNIGGESAQAAFEKLTGQLLPARLSPTDEG